MNENILVIEHRDDLLNKIIDILKERHYNPISTKSRSQANTIANESDIGLIILDVDIADSQGLQLLETFKEQEKTKGIPVILISTPYKKIEFMVYLIPILVTIYGAIQYDINGHKGKGEKICAFFLFVYL